MKKYTQADFDEMVRGQIVFLYCESGDWSEVDFHGAKKVIFSDWCKLGDWCTLGNECKLGNGCKLGDECTLGDECNLESDRVANATFFKISNIGSRNDSVYFYCNRNTGAIYVRAGCWFSCMEAFIVRVKKVHKGSEYETDYLAAVELAKARFAKYAEGRCSIEYKEND